MTPTQQILFDHLMETQVRQFLPTNCLFHYSHILDQREDALLETMTDQQRKLFESYQEAADDMNELEQQALFRATWSMAHELLCP